jgi:Tol biopolymer transport system component
MSSDGSGERKLRDLQPATFAYTGCPASFSADGRFLSVAVARPDGGAELRRLKAEGGADDLLAVVDTGQAKGYHHPVYSPDGRYLAVLQYYNRNSADLVIVPASPDGRVTGEPRRLTRDRLPIHGLTWAPGSNSIIYSVTRNGSDALWRVGLKGETPELVPGGDQGQYPSVAVRSGKLSFAVLNENRSLWRIPLSPAGEMTGPPTRVTSSTRRDEGPVFSRDGRKLSFFSDRTGAYEVWMCDADGGQPRALTHFGGAFAGLSDWSPDGRTLVFDAVTAATQHDVFTVATAGGDARVVIQGPGLDVAPTWSRDGQHIYFTSDRSGRFQVWRAERDGRNPVQITQAGGWYAREAEDGFLYYSSAAKPVEIRRVLPAGGAEEAVVPGIRPRFWGHWAMSRGRIFMIHTPDHLSGGPGLPAELWLFDLATQSLRNLGRLPGTIVESTPAIAVSPDGRSLVYSRVDSAAGDLFMLDNFH